MATYVGSVHNSSDLVKDYVCGPCESKTIEESADYFCATCMKFFCRKCINLHDQLYANHTKYGREETNKWPLTKALEDYLLKCDVHMNEKQKMFCQDHSQLCCSDCAFLNHRSRNCQAVHHISKMCGFVDDAGPINLSLMKNGKKKGSYVISILDESKEAQGWSSEEEVFNVSEARNRTSTPKSTPVKTKTTILQ